MSARHDKLWRRVENWSSEFGFILIRNTVCHRWNAGDLNVGLKRMRDLYSMSKDLDMMGRFHSDIFYQDH